MARNLRKRARISYSEFEEPDLDEYIFCSGCEDYVYEYCSIHGPLLVVPDTRIPADAKLPSHITRAMLTLPHVFFHIAPSSIPGAGLGVFCSRAMPADVRFGPYTGTITQVATSDYCWQIYNNDRSPRHLVDGGDAAAASWLRYVNCCRTWREQNAVAFQLRGQIYYRTIRVIPRGAELLVYYGSEFAKKLGLGPFAEKYALEEGNNKIEDLPKTQVNKTAKISRKNLKSAEILTPSSSEVTQTNFKCEHCDFSGTTGDLLKQHSCSHEEKRKTNDAKKKKLSSKTQSIANNTKTTQKASETKPIQDKKDQTIEKVITECYFKCQHCDYKAITADLLKKHSRFHDASRGYECNVCKFKFTTNSDLQTHLKVHTELKYFSCKECAYKSNKSANLKTHVRHIHTGVKPYHCNQCEYMSSQASSLKTHVRIHTGEKPYHCNQCEFKSKSASSLKRHVRIHTGEKPYHCNKCEFKSSDASNLKIHMKKHTGLK